MRRSRILARTLQYQIDPRLEKDDIRSLATCLINWNTQVQYSDITSLTICRRILVLMNTSAFYSWQSSISPAPLRQSAISPERIEVDAYSDCQTIVLSSRHIVSRVQGRMWTVRTKQMVPSHRFHRATQDNNLLGTLSRPVNTRYWTAHAERLLNFKLTCSTPLDEVRARQSEVIQIATPLSSRHRLTFHESQYYEMTSLRSFVPRQESQ